MNNFIFQYPTKVYFGKGCVKEYLCCLLKKQGPTVMLAYGGGSVKRTGVYDQMMELLHEAGKTVVEFGGIMPNPTYAKVQEGAALCRENGVDFILAVGGGSVIDCCTPASSTSTAIWGCSATPWALRARTATRRPTPVPPTSGPSTPSIPWTGASLRPGRQG